VRHWSRWHWPTGQHGERQHRQHAADDGHQRVTAQREQHAGAEGRRTPSRTTKAGAARKDPATLARAECAWVFDGAGVGTEKLDGTNVIKRKDFPRRVAA
jgi:hypothetical protein